MCAQFEKGLLAIFFTFAYGRLGSDIALIKQNGKIKVHEGLGNISALEFKQTVAGLNIG